MQNMENPCYQKKYGGWAKSKMDFLTFSSKKWKIHADRATSGQSRKMPETQLSSAFTFSGIVILTTSGMLALAVLRWPLWKNVFFIQSSRPASSPTPAAAVAAPAEAEAAVHLPVKISPLLTSPCSVEAAIACALHVGPETRSKIARFRAAAARRELAIVSDFDRTLTAFDSVQCHDMMRDAACMPAAFRGSMATLFDFSLPSTCAMTTDEWWGTANRLLLDHGWHGDMIGPTVAAAAPRPRPGLVSLLGACDATGTPLIVVSAGFSDIIEHFLEGLLPRRGSGTSLDGHRTDHAAPVMVSANKMVFDDSGRLVGWEPAAGPVHSKNKALTYAREAAFFRGRAMEGRSRWVVLGDSPHDVDTVSGAPPGAFTEALTIGFFDHTVPPERQRYPLGDFAAAYDLVLPANHAQGLAPVADIIQNVL